MLMEQIIYNKTKLSKDDKCDHEKTFLYYMNRKNLSYDECISDITFIIEYCEGIKCEELGRKIEERYYLKKCQDLAKSKISKHKRVHRH